MPSFSGWPLSVAVRAHAFANAVRASFPVDCPAYSRQDAKPVEQLKIVIKEPAWASSLHVSTMIVLLLLLLVVSCEAVRSTRRAVIGGAAAAAVASSPILRAGAFEGDESIVEPVLDDALTPTVVDDALLTPPPPPPPKEIEYSELVSRLSTCRETGVCDVERVDFKSAKAEAAVARIGGSERTVLNLPIEDPSNDSSPLKLVARCRDANVPYVFSDLQAALKSTRGSSVLSAPKLPSLPKLF